MVAPEVVESLPRKESHELRSDWRTTRSMGFPAESSTSIRESSGDFSRAANTSKTQSSPLRASNLKVSTSPGWLMLPRISAGSSIGWASVARLLGSCSARNGGTVLGAATSGPAADGLWALVSVKPDDLGPSGEGVPRWIASVEPSILASSTPPPGSCCSEVTVSGCAGRTSKRSSPGRLHTLSERSRAALNRRSPEGRIIIEVIAASWA